VSKEPREFRDNFVSDKVVYLLKPLNPDFEIGTSVDGINWFSKYDSQDIHIELKLFLLGDWDRYFECVIKLSDRSFGSAGIPHLEHGTADSDYLMLVDIAEFVELPEQMFLERCFSDIRLKAVNDIGGLRREIGDRFPISRASLRRSLVNRETCPLVGCISPQQCQLPSQMIETRTETIGEFSGQSTEVVGGDCDFNDRVMNALPRIVLGSDSVTILPKLGNNLLEFFEMFIRPTKFYFCMCQPDT
jgi:hypothetical protein